MELFTDKTGDVKTASKNSKGTSVCGNSWNRMNLTLLLNLGNWVHRAHYTILNDL